MHLGFGQGTLFVVQAAFALMRVPDFFLECCAGGIGFGNRCERVWAIASAEAIEQDAVSGRHALLFIVTNMFVNIGMKLHGGERTGSTTLTCSPYSAAVSQKAGITWWYRSLGSFESGCRLFDF